ncbi:ArsR/SmtB family transcription factor [Salininema proteolyticum]|uniref:ArsR/SmtB family transcription factor n=1 Tax=Salininema proteolyticum TaxID=1607685 RepID=A0ABV8TY57_9ACTN
MSNQASDAAADLADCRVPLVREPLNPAQAERLAPSFKALGDPVRLRLLSLIASHEGGRVCVCDLTGSFDLKAPTISHHLKVLKDHGLVTSERRGTWIYYTATAETLDLLSTVLSVREGAAA